MTNRVMLAVVTVAASWAAAPAARAASAGPSPQDKKPQSVLLVALAPTAAQSQKRPAPTPNPSSAATEMVEIDGATHPELLPDYMVWTHGLSALATIKKNNITAALETLPLSPRDADLAFAAGSAQDERDRQCGERTRRIMEAGRGEEPAKIEAALRPAVLECRWAVLEAKDRLLDAMSPEGRATLMAWMLDRRKRIKAYVPKGDLEFFRQPR